jgi:hypothetical protein
VPRRTLAPLALALASACTRSELPPAPATAPPAAWTPAPGWPQPLPDLGPTHGGLAFDRAGRLWAGTDGPLGLVAFAPDGSLAASLPQFSGTHSLLLREEQGEERLYAAHLREHRVVKLRLDGTLLLELRAPAESGAYADPAAFNPTAVAVAPDGRLFVADGYGTSLIHAFDAQGRWLSAFGGAGEGDGRCNTPHGLLLDTRCEPPRLLVADRENRRLLHFGLDGGFLGVHAAGLRRPCAMALREGRLADGLLAVAELEGRVAVLERDGTLRAAVGDNPRADERANFEVAPSAWSSDVLCAPHGVAFAPGGDLLVADWSRSGRISRWAER